MDEIELAARDHQAPPQGAAICAGKWRPPAIETACLLAHAVSRGGGGGVVK